MCVAVQRLAIRQLFRSKLAEQLDVIGAGERSKHFRHLSAAARARQFSLVVLEAIVNRSQTAARRDCIKLPLGSEITPEDERVSSTRVRPGVEKIARRHDGRTRTCEVLGDVEFARDIIGVDSRSAARHTGDDRQRL
jgi:hypothetical protein